MVRSWEKMQTQEWACSWGISLVFMQFAIFFVCAAPSSYIINAADESFLFWELHEAGIHLIMPYIISIVPMLVCFHLLIGKFPKHLILSEFNIGKDIWLAIVLVSIITIVAYQFVHESIDPPNSVMFPLDISILKFAQYVIIAPPVEEWLYRGILYPYLRKHLPFVWAIMTNAVLFSLAHFGPLPRLFSSFAVGFVLAYYYERFRSITVCIVIHAVANMIAAFIVFLFTHTQDSRSMSVVFMEKYILEIIS